MALLAIPNVSEGRDRLTVERFGARMTAQGAKVLDIHTDAHHNRAVFTTTGRPGDLVGAMVALAAAAREALDLTTHEGVHPRVGVLDVCPFVPHGQAMDEAVDAARQAAASIGNEVGLPVYLYGAASSRGGTVSLPEIRRGGIHALIERASRGFAPDHGPTMIDPRHGVVCVGARDVLIAFNVCLRCSEDVARSIAAGVRSSGGGPPGIRALGVPIGKGTSQVTMNLIDPTSTSIEGAFEVVARAAEERGVEVTATEIVGLVPERYAMDQNARAARLLKEPGRTLESALEGLLAPPG